MKMPCSGCQSSCKPCQSIDLNRFKQKEKGRKPVDPAETISDIDALADEMRSALIKLRASIGKKATAPVGAFIFKKKITNPSGKIYEYWFVRGHDSDKITSEKSLGSTKREGKQLKDYRCRIARRDQIEAVDARLSQIENYLQASILNIFPGTPVETEKEEEKDGS